MSDNILTVAKPHVKIRRRMKWLTVFNEYSWHFDGITGKGLTVTGAYEQWQMLKSDSQRATTDNLS